MFAPIYRILPWCAQNGCPPWDWWLRFHRWWTIKASLAGPILSCSIEIPILLLKNNMSLLGWTQICLTGTLYIFECLRIRYSTRIPKGCPHFSHRSMTTKNCGKYSVCLTVGGEKFKSEINLFWDMYPQVIKHSPISSGLSLPFTSRIFQPAMFDYRRVDPIIISLNPMKNAHIMSYHVISIDGMKWSYQFI